MDKNYTFRKFRTVGTLMQGLHIDNSAIEKFSITRKLSMSTLMGEIKPVVLVTDKFEYREKLKCFRLEVSEYQDSDEREKNDEIFVDYSSTSALCSIVILMNEIELLVAETSI